MEQIILSENINLGVLPPGRIDNNKISDNVKNDEKLKLKKGLKIQKDYIVVNQLLWEWFLFNYGGGPEISVENNSLSSPFLFSIEENKTNYLKKEESFEDNINTKMDNIYNLDYENKKKYINKSDNKNVKLTHKIKFNDFKDMNNFEDNEMNISDSENEIK